MRVAEAVVMETWKEIKVGEGSFEVLIRRPSYLERVRNLGFQIATDREPGANEAAAIAFRLETTVVGWQRIERPDGEPLEFSIENLHRVCEQYPAIFVELARLSAEAFRSTAATEEEAEQERGNG